MTRLFRDRIAAAAEEKNSRVVLALDPPASVSDGREFAERMVGLVQEHVCAIKVNFHLILPLAGSEIAKVNRLAHSYGLQCIADIKLNDIENTNDVAIDHLIGRMGFDSVIVNPFIGTAALDSLVKKARSAEGGIIALVYMSHPGAKEGFGLYVGGKEELYKIFLERAERADADGIVVGASQLAVIREISAERRIPIYSPGIGMQGGDPEAAAKSGADYLIIGRSITESKDPAVVAGEIQKRISSSVRN